MEIGRIELIIGCMYSGKTTELIRLINRYKSLNKPMLIINYIEDNRYGNDNKIYTHNKLGIEAKHITHIEDIYNNPKLLEEYNNSEIIFINEGQFFTNLYEFVINSVDKDNKIFIICGLDGDYQKKPFGDILKLIPHSDKLTRLNAMCKICGDGTPGIFTYRKIESDKQKLIGGDDIYIPVCRKHYK